ncbi:hypothetical protein CMO92_02600 [Candidatus Woesearchaeota archaeon]|nr:hypothetical protein [Candidatus Woesearchaeota archaeon]|tara:strand:+ start:1755 stop:2636 length:882 start_codon:yes stop_codon:yes gene_type:complete
MALKDDLAKRISNHEISEENVLSLEKEIAEARSKVGIEFREIVGDKVEEIQDAITEGLEEYITGSFYDERYSVQDTLPHFKSDFIIHAKKYVQQVGTETLFGAKLILKHVCEYFHIYSDEDGTLSDTAFLDSEECWRVEYKYLPFQSLYAKRMSEGIPEIIEVDGTQMLKIYRGLEVPPFDTCSTDDEEKIDAGTINLTNPGVDWTPIRAFAGRYQGEKGYGVLLSALVPIDDEEILRESISDSEGLDDDWRGEDDPDLEKLTDCLIVGVSVSCYRLLKDLKIEYTDATFEIR